jgi:hypothetical protein
MQFEMPKPTPEHARLAAMAGSWTSVETMFPSPWDPNTTTRTGRSEARVAMGGFFVICDYEQSKDGHVAYRGHGVYGYDPKSKRWSMHWFDDMGGVPAQTVWGTWEGDTLTYEAVGPQGPVRYVYRFVKDGEYVFSIQACPGGGEWKPFMEGRFTRR